MRLERMKKRRIESLENLKSRLRYARDEKSNSTHPLLVQFSFTFWIDLSICFLSACSAIRYLIIQFLFILLAETSLPWSSQWNLNKEPSQMSIRLAIGACHHKIYREWWILIWSNGVFDLNWTWMIENQLKPNTRARIRLSKAEVVQMK